jgi:NAD(P)-dependent dehydrogenase (short-subunit alcohol dehydrogenase family)
MRRCLEVNVVAPAVLNGVVRKFMGHRSSIIYMGSTLSEKGVPDRASYVASKHALAGIMKVTCQDLGQEFASAAKQAEEAVSRQEKTAAGEAKSSAVVDEVHTAMVCPGFTGTEMLLEHLERSSELHEIILKKQTMGRILDPEEVARVVLFCAENPSVNGSVVHCNLGQVER